MPTEPSVVIGAADDLGDLVRTTLGEGVDVVVLGFAETATGLGHCVAARLHAHCYLHSTRRDVPGATTLAGFEEGHSHATSHLMQPDVRRTVRERPASGPRRRRDLHRRHRDRCHPGAARAMPAKPLRRGLAGGHENRGNPSRRRSRGGRVECTNRLRLSRFGSTVLPDGLTERVTALDAPDLNPIGDRRGTLSQMDLPWPAHVPDGGRHGFLDGDTAAFESAVEAAVSISDRRSTRRVL